MKVDIFGYSMELTNEFAIVNGHCFPVNYKNLGNRYYQFKVTKINIDESFINVLEIGNPLYEDLVKIFAKEVISKASKQPFGRFKKVS